MSFTREIIDRRVLPAVGVYVGASWVVVEILDRLVERYFLSPYITDIVFWGLYSLIPAVVLLAWTHGRPGKDRVTRLEKVGIPINIIATVGLLLTVFGDKNMSATADLVTVANELGQSESHYVPRESYRRRIATFFWDSEGLDPGREWLRYGVTDLLTQDLQQNPFLLATSPWDDGERRVYEEMVQSGFENGLGLPLTLKREISDLANRDYFIDGTISEANGEVTLTGRVWRTESMELVAEIPVTGFDLLSAVDELSERVRDVLDTPNGSSDLPLAETYGESTDALRHYIDGRNAVLLGNDRAAANRHYDLALAEDPDFVLGWLMKSHALWQQSRAAESQEALAQVRRLLYRLPERDQFNVKIFTYRITGEQDKLETLLRMQTQIEGDGGTYHNLGAFLMLAGKLEEAKEAFERQMQVDSSAVSARLFLAQLDRALGNFDAAIGHTRAYMEFRPEDVGARILLGDLLLETGDMEAARESYEGAQILEDPPMASTLKLALLAIRQGEWARVHALVDESRMLAASPRHVSQVLGVEAFLEARLGRLERAMERVEQQYDYIQQVVTPVEQVFTYNIPLIQLNLHLGRVEQAESVLLRAKEALNPPMTQFLAFSEVELQAHKGDVAAARSALEQGIDVIDHFKADFMAFMVPLSEAWIAEAEGDYSRAGRHFQESIRLARSSAVAAGQLDGQSEWYANCAIAHVRAGELDLAQRVLDFAFRRDSAEPRLWVARALLQDAQGAPHMALASINYALAIWSGADADYGHYREAQALKQRFESSTP